MLVPDQTLHYVGPFEGANIEQAAIDFNGIDPHSPLRRWMVTALKKCSSPFKAQPGCQRCILVGHNATFDHGFVMAAAERANLKRNPFHPFVTYDTAALAAVFFGQTVLIKLAKQQVLSLTVNKRTQPSTTPNAQPNSSATWSTATKPSAAGRWAGVHAG